MSSQSPFLSFLRKIKLNDKLDVVCRYLWWVLRDWNSVNNECTLATNGSGMHSSLIFLWKNGSLHCWLLFIDRRCTLIKDVHSELTIGELVFETAALSTDVSHSSSLNFKTRSITLNFKIRSSTLNFKTYSDRSIVSILLRLLWSVQFVKSVWNELLLLWPKAVGVPHLISSDKNHGPKMLQVRQLSKNCSTDFNFKWFSHSLQAIKNLWSRSNEIKNP